MRNYLQHGPRHSPRGSDATPTDQWHNIGDTGEPPFVNGSNAAPTGTVPNPVPCRFRLSVGPPNECTYDYTTTPATPLTIVTYTYHQLEIQMDVTGVSPGATVFNLPIEYQHEFDVPYHTHDDLGAYVPCRLLATGEFLYSVP